MSEGVGGADRHSGGGWIWLSLTGCVTNFRISEASVQYAELGNAIGSGSGLSITSVPIYCVYVWVSVCDCGLPISLFQVGSAEPLIT